MVTLLGKHALIAHPLAGSPTIRAVEVEVWMTDGDDVLLTYSLVGAQPVWPDWTVSTRAGELWITTCFELFLKTRDAKGYHEFNFSPSTQWAAYAFDAYRSGRRDLALPIDPRIEREEPVEHKIGLTVDVDLSAIPNAALEVGLSAVIEELDGTKSYWALTHPNPDKPDFHDPACFTLELPPAPHR